jgi:hypothetical protein
MYDKNYYLAHREEILARAKKWREDHPEQYRKALKRCVKRNGLKYKIQQKLYRCANWGKIQQQQKEYYDNNKDNILERCKKYRLAHILKMRAVDLRNKTRKRYQKIKDWSISYEIQNGRFRWHATKGKYNFSDDKENGFPSLHSAYKNAIKYLGDPVLRG